MRLFIALALDDSIRQFLGETMERLRAAGASGNFTRPENLHLTLHFLGEQPPARADAARCLLENFPAGKDSFSPFELELAGFGQFGGGVAWVGLQRSEPLLRLQQQLGDALLRAEFLVDNRPFHPHLTLGREIRLPPGFDTRAFAETIKPLRQTVTDLRLMRSRRVDGVLTYSPLAIRPLEAVENPESAGI